MISINISIFPLANRLVRSRLTLRSEPVLVDRNHRDKDQLYEKKKLSNHLSRPEMEMTLFEVKGTSLLEICK